MEIDKLNEAAQNAMLDTGRLQRIAEDYSAKATLKKFVDQLPEVQIRRALSDSSVAQIQRALNAPALTAFHKQIEETAARFHAAFDDSALRAFDAMAKKVAADLRAFDSIAAQHAEQMRAAFDNSALAAAQKYLDEQAAVWGRIKVLNALTDEGVRTVSPPPASFQIKARVPKIRLTPQAKQEHIPAPVEPAVEIPSAAHWLASALEVILTKGAYKRTVEPHVVDMRDEYQDAVRGNRNARAVWAIVRGHLVIVATQLNRLKGWLGLWF